MSDTATRSFTSSTAGKAALFAAGIAIGTVLLPSLGGFSGVFGLAESLVRSTAGSWSAEACERDAVGCLIYRKAELERTQSGIDGAVNQLRPAGERLAELLRQHERRYGENDLLLKEGRAILQRNAEADRAIRFVGETYPDREALLRQLQVLFSEREAMERFLTQARTQATALRSRHDELLVSRGEVRSALAMIPSQIELARSNGLLAQLGVTMQRIDATVVASDRRITGVDALMRTTEELSVARQREATAATVERSSAGSAAFQAFMGRRD